MPGGRQHEQASLPPNRCGQAYDRLVSVLQSGEIEPGTRLTEAELTQMLNVSRGTIRSVLVRLAQEGYVTSEVNRGVRTRMFSVTDAVEILEAREVLEAALAGKAAERATPEERDGLTRTVGAMREARLNGEQDEYSRLNRGFHQQIRKAAHQETLARFCDALRYPLVMRQYRNLAAPHPRAGSLEEHQAILSAIITRNPEAASAAMRHHIAAAREGLLLGEAPGQETAVRSTRVAHASTSAHSGTSTANACHTAAPDSAPPASTRDAWTR
jgi:DNA-binding GntR family transcriptional regulator